MLELHVDSRNATIKQYISDENNKESYRISLPNAINLNKFRYMKVMNAQIAATWYNISESNCSFTFDTSANGSIYNPSGHTTVKVPFGHYNSVDAVLAALNLALSVLSSGTLTAALLSPTGIVTLTYTPNVLSALVSLNYYHLPNSLLCIGFPNTFMSNALDYSTGTITSTIINPVVKVKHLIGDWNSIAVTILSGNSMYVAFSAAYDPDESPFSFDGGVLNAWDPVLLQNCNFNNYFNGLWYYAGPSYDDIQTYYDDVTDTLVRNKVLLFVRTNQQNSNITFQGLSDKVESGRLNGNNIPHTSNTPQIKGTIYQVQQYLPPRFSYFIQTSPTCIPYGDTGPSGDIPWIVIENYPQGHTDVFSNVTDINVTRYTGSSKIVDGVTSYVIRSPAVSILEQDASVYIVSEKLSSLTVGTTHMNTNPNSNIGQGIIAKIPMTCSSFQQLQHGDHQSSSWVRITNNSGILQNFDVSLKFAGLRPILNLHGSDWSFTVSFACQPRV